jgi:hypothetical protein
MSKADALKILDELRERCRQDPDFKEKLRAKPVETMTEAGIPAEEIDHDAMKPPQVEAHGIQARAYTDDQTLLACTARWTTCCCVRTACCVTYGTTKCSGEG